MPIAPAKTKPSNSASKTHKPTAPRRAKQAKPTQWGVDLLGKMEAFRKALAAQ
jgi:hypothetical protein